MEASMNRNSIGNLTGLLVTGLAVMLGCQEKSAIGPEPGGTGGASSGVGGAAGSVGWSKDSGPAELACPSGTAGSKQVLITLEDGRGYCIDQLEVTRAEYRIFLDSKKGDTSGQPAECAKNLSFEPPQDPEEDPETACPSFSVDAYPQYRGYPVVCVDFCDAFAYCAWAGKRLCGKIGANEKGVQTIAQGGFERVAGSTESEWTYACSQGGKTKYPYGDEYVAGACIDWPRLQERGGQARLADAEDETCHGTEPPFDQIYHLSGSVPEWVNFYDPATVSSITMGGHAAQTEDYLSCTRAVATYIFRQQGTLGFRCCADAVAVPALP
jgi:formylglycine-generating enzyme